MPAHLLLERIAFADGAPRRGYAVVTACTYDGRKGVQVAESQLPPLKIQRTRGSRWRHNFAGDGLLIRRWEEPPEAFGYVVFITVTNKLEAALEVSAAATATVAAGAAAAGVAPMTGVAGAVGGLLKAIKGVSGARVVGALVGSEVDAEGTGADWSFRQRADAVHYTLCYDVVGDDDAPGDDEE